MNDISDMSKLSFFKMGKYVYDTSFTCDFREIPRPHFCMGLIIKGEGDFVSGGETVHVKRGDIIFVPVGSTYVSYWSGKPDILYISAHFSFENPSSFLRRKKIKIQKISLSGFENLKEKFSLMYEKYAGTDTSQFYVLSLFFEIMSRVFPLLRYNEVKKIDAQIEKAAEYIERNYREDFCVEQLAAASNMSTSHFYSRFKSSLGCSPIEYKHRICIRRAELMLIDDSEKSIEEISEFLGFCSSAYFRRIFKKITGKTPRDYRKAGAEL